MCGICFEPLQPQERRQELDCGHCYHENCITTWAQKKSVALSEACLYRCHIKKDDERFFDKDIDPVQTESVPRTATTTAHDNNDNNDNNNNANVITNNNENNKVNNNNNSEAMQIDSVKHNNNDNNDITMHDNDNNNDKKSDKKNDNNNNDKKNDNNNNEVNIELSPLPPINMEQLSASGQED